MEGGAGDADGTLPTPATASLLPLSMFRQCPNPPNHDEFDHGSPSPISSPMLTLSREPREPVALATPGEAPGEFGNLVSPGPAQKQEKQFPLLPPALWFSNGPQLDHLLAKFTKGDGDKSPKKPRPNSPRWKAMLAPPGKPWAQAWSFSSWTRRGPICDAHEEHEGNMAKDTAPWGRNDNKPV